MPTVTRSSLAAMALRRPSRTIGLSSAMISRICLCAGAGLSGTSRARSWRAMARAMSARSAEPRPMRIVPSGTRSPAEDAVRRARVELLRLDHAGVDEKVRAMVWCRLIENDCSIRRDPGGRTASRCTRSPRPRSRTRGSPDHRAPSASQRERRASLRCFEARGTRRIRRARFLRRARRAGRSPGDRGARR